MSEFGALPLLVPKIRVRSWSNIDQLSRPSVRTGRVCIDVPDLMTLYQRKAKIIHQLVGARISNLASRDAEVWASEFGVV